MTVILSSPLPSRALYADRLQAEKIEHDHEIRELKFNFTTKIHKTKDNHFAFIFFGDEDLTIVDQVLNRIYASERGSTVKTIYKPTDFTDQIVSFRHSITSMIVMTHRHNYLVIVSPSRNMAIHIDDHQHLGTFGNDHYTDLTAFTLTPVEIFESLLEVSENYFSKEYDVVQATDLVKIPKEKRR